MARNLKPAFIYTDEVMSYTLAKGHPFNPIRVKLTYELLKDLNVLKEDQIIKPRIASKEEILLGHSKSYVDFVSSLNYEEDIDENLVDKFGIGTEDTPVFNKIHEASSLIVGSTLTSIEEVLEKRANHSLNLMGGLHHAFYGKASGFCVYNDIVIGIKYILKYYDLKVLYIDTDAHHGDGVQWAFYDEPKVCTLSIHETGRYLFPGTGAIHERGEGQGYGYCFNIPLDAFTEDESWCHCFIKSVETITEYFKPDVIITQHGVDGHFLDPLTHLSLTIETYKFIPYFIHKLSHKYCNGKWIALGGGGYNIFSVVPRAWSLIWLEMNGEKTPDKIPESWKNKWSKYTNIRLPTLWEDEEIYDPIPRKNEIEYKNQITLKNALYTIENEIVNRFFK